MYPKNAIAYKFNPSEVDLSQLADKLAENPLREPGPLELECVGFLPQTGIAGDPFTISIENFLTFAVGIRKKVLPASVINERVTAKVRELLAKGEHVGSKVRKRLKESITDELMRVAFNKLTVIRGFIDKRGWVFFDTSSVKNAELALSEVREALGSLPAIPPQAGAISQTFGHWVRNGECPEDFAFGDSCVLMLPDAGSRWAGKGVDVCGVEVEEHLNAGSIFERLGLTYKDRLSFTFDNVFVVKSLKWLDTDEERELPEDIEEALQATLLHIGGDVTELLNNLVTVFEVAE